MAISRNEPCSCGSGWKYKFCCAAERRRLPWVAGIAVLSFVLLGGLVVAWRVRVAAQTGLVNPDGKVWSVEHGHWHDTAKPNETPDGPAPPGKVWSAEHGHWHNAEEGGSGLPAAQ